MAYTTLKTDYANDVLNENVNTNVVYVMTDLSDSSTKNITLQDATSYTTLGDSLDASVVNGINTVVNAHSTDLTQAKSDILTNAGDISTNASNITKLLASKVDLDVYASPGTTDGDLVAALTALGWLSDVVE